MSDINNYMTPSEAAHRWNVPQETVKNYLKPSKNKNIDQMIKDGLIKYFQKPDGTRKEWIISKEAMEIWFGECK